MKINVNSVLIALTLAVLAAGVYYFVRPSAVEVPIQGDQPIFSNKIYGLCRRIDESTVVLPRLRNGNWAVMLEDEAYLIEERKDFAVTQGRSTVTVRSEKNCFGKYQLYIINFNGTSASPSRSFP